MPQLLLPTQCSDGLVIIVGGAVVDIQAQPSNVDLQRGTSVPGRVRQVAGGVARNIAEGLSRMLEPPTPPPMLASLVGDDGPGAFLLSNLRGLRLDLSLLVTKEGMSTPCVVAAFDKSGELTTCVADVAALEHHLTPDLVSGLLSRPAREAGSGVPSVIGRAALLVVEANLAEEAVEAACRAAAAARVPIFMEPVSVPKSVRQGSSTVFLRRHATADVMYLLLQ